MTQPDAAAPHPVPNVQPDEAARGNGAGPGAAPGRTTREADAPPCPLCSTPMVVRLSRRGPTAGSRYWGCPRDPECGGRRMLEPGSPGPAPRAPGSAPRATAALPPAPRLRASTGIREPMIAPPRPLPDTTSLPSAGDDRARLRLRPDVLAIAAVMAITGIALTLIGPGPEPGAPGLASPIGVGLVGLAVVIALASVVVPPRHRGRQPRGDAERATSRALAPLTDEGWVVLEDRRMPASSELVRHLLIGPGGVFVIASRSLPGRVGIRGHDLYLNGRRRTAIVEQARRQAAAVVTALRGAGHADNATALLCVYRAQLPVFGASLHGVAIVDDTALVRRLREEPPKLNPERVALLTEALERALPIAVRPTD